MQQARARARRTESRGTAHLTLIKGRGIIHPPINATHTLTTVADTAEVCIKGLTSDGSRIPLI